MLEKVFPDSSLLVQWDLRCSQTTNCSNHPSLIQTAPIFTFNQSLIDAYHRFGSFYSLTTIDYLCLFQVHDDAIYETQTIPQSRATINTTNLWCQGELIDATKNSKTLSRPSLPTAETLHTFLTRTYNAITLITALVCTLTALSSLQCQCHRFKLKPFTLPLRVSLAHRYVSTSQFRTFILYISHKLHRWGTRQTMQSWHPWSEWYGLGLFGFFGWFLREEWRKRDKVFGDGLFEFINDRKRYER